MKRKVPSRASVQRWRVITELQAESAEAAIKRAIKEHGINDPHRQSRLAAYRVA